MIVVVLPNHETKNNHMENITLISTFMDTNAKYFFSDICTNRWRTHLGRVVTPTLILQLRDVVVGVPIDVLELVIVRKRYMVSSNETFST